MSNKWKVFWVISFALVVFFQACGLHSWQETLISKEDEKRMGREFDSIVQHESKNPSAKGDILAAGESLFEPKNAEQTELYEYYQDRAKEIVNAIDSKDLEALLPSDNICGSNKKQKCTKDNFFEFKLINSKTVNAFAVPGGYVYFYTAILKEPYFQSESELASVLAHEVGHIVLHHSRDRIVKQAVAAGLIDALLGDGMGGVLAQLGTGVWLMSHSQDDEFAADSMGFYYTNKIGISSEGLSAFFDRGLKKDANGVCTGAESSVLDVFSTHPPSCERVKRNRDKMAQIGQNFPMDKNTSSGKTYKELVEAAGI